MPNPLTAKDFYENVVVPNNAAQHGDTGNLRLAFNAIASLDAYVGIWTHELLSAGKTTLKEDAFRDLLADRSVHYRALRDMAFALKHGELQHKKVRMVRRAAGLATQSAAFDPGAFGDGYQNKELILIEFEEGGGISVWKLIDQAMSAITDLQNDLA